MEATPARQVTLANALIRSVHGLNIGEKRLLMYAISKIDSRVKPTLETFCIKVTVADMVKEFGLTPDKAYQLTKQAAEGLMDRQVRFVGGFVTNADIEILQWVTLSAYKVDEAWVLIEINPRLAPFLAPLREHFTSYRLSKVSGFKSIYSWRVFELFMQFKKTGLLTINTDEFCKLLEVPHSISSNFANLRQKVIDPSVKEIQEKGGVTVTYKPIKTGRKVTGLTFTFTLAVELPQPIALIQPEPKPLTMKQAKQIRAEQQRLSAVEAQSRAQFEKLAAQYGYSFGDYSDK